MDPRRKADNLSKVVWDKKIIIEFTRPVSSTKVVPTALMMGIKVSKEDTDLKPVKHIIKNPQSSLGISHVQKKSLLHINCKTMHLNLSQLKKDNPLQRNC